MYFYYLKLTPLITYDDLSFKKTGLNVLSPDTR